MKRCLVAESSDVIRKALRSYLEKLGYDVIEAEDGVTALEIFHAQRPDAVVLDGALTETTTVEILSAIRFAKHTPSPYVVYLTTENDRDEFARFHRAGAHAVMLKPFDRNSVNRIMGRLAAQAA